MTKEEVCSCCRISSEIIKEYESWGFSQGDCADINKCDYSEKDLENLSMILTLKEIGFGKEDIKKYILLMNSGNMTEARRKRMLDSHRNNTLKEIHNRERQLEKMDYLRNEIKSRLESK